MKNEKNFRGVFAINMLPKKIRKDESGIIKLQHLIVFRIPPPPGGTAILPEYIHYYGYYYQVIVQCLST
jgi:hypothetical protein